MELKLTVIVNMEKSLSNHCWIKTGSFLQRMHPKENLLALFTKFISSVVDFGCCELLIGFHFLI